MDFLVKLLSWLFSIFILPLEVASSTVDGSLIYRSLFSEKSFPNVFKPIKEYNSVFGKQFDQPNPTFIPPKHLSIPLSVIDPRAPVTIGNESNVLFWGLTRLPPSSILPECVNYVTSNDKQKVPYCEVPKMDRCSRNIIDIPHFAPFTIFAPSGVEITQFGWLCPEGKHCCEWTCCNHYVGEAPTHKLKLMITVVGSFFAICYVVGIFRLIHDCQKRKKQKERNAQRNASNGDQAVPLRPVGEENGVAQ